MKRKIGFLVILIGFIIIVLVLYKILGGGGPREGIIRVTSTPSASVFIDNKQAGKTPYESKVAAGEVNIKLVPDATITQLSSWEGKLSVASNTLTYVNRDLAPTDLSSAGEVLSLEKISSKNSEISVTSTPDSATVLLDNENKGVTPIAITGVTAGDHALTLTSTGFLTRTIRIKTTAGYKLDVLVQLALSSFELPSEATASPTPEATPGRSTPKPTAKLTPTPTKKVAPSETEIAKPYVLVGDTPTGFLRVRMEPSTAATEAARVKPGEKFPFVSEKTDSKGTTWFEVTYEDELTGWVSSQYAEKVE